MTHKIQANTNPLRTLSTTDFGTPFAAAAQRYKQPQPQQGNPSLLSSAYLNSMGGETFPTTGPLAGKDETTVDCSELAIAVLKNCGIEYNSRTGRPASKPFRHFTEEEKIKIQDFLQRNLNPDAYNYIKNSDNFIKMSRTVRLHDLFHDLAKYAYQAENGPSNPWDIDMPYPQFDNKEGDHLVAIFDAKKWDAYVLPKVETPKPAPKPVVKPKPKPVAAKPKTVPALTPKPTPAPLDTTGYYQTTVTSSNGKPSVDLNAFLSLMRTLNASDPKIRFTVKDLLALPQSDEVRAFLYGRTPSLPVGTVVNTGAKQIKGDK